MSESKHTPGPWACHIPKNPVSSEEALDVGISAAVNGETKIIAEAYGQVNHGSFSPAAANARLIAMAPDLLAALIETSEAIADNLSATEDDVVRDDPVLRTHGAVLGRARDAITKAEGKH